MKTTSFYKLQTEYLFDMVGEFVDVFEVLLMCSKCFSVFLSFKYKMGKKYNRFASIHSYDYHQISVIFSDTLFGKLLYLYVIDPLLPCNF